MKRKKIKEKSGVTLISLAITVVVIIIIAGIAVYTGKETIQKAKLGELRTNMLLIQAKAKEYAEEANFKMGPTPDDSKKETVRAEVYEGEAKLQKATDITSPNSIPLSECYKVTQETLENWGLEKIKIKDDENYLIKFDDTNATVEIYNTSGYEGKYSLTEIDNIQ